MFDFLSTNIVRVLCDCDCVVFLLTACFYFLFILYHPHLLVVITWC